MANETLSSITAAGTLDGTEIAYVVKGGNSRRTTTQDIADLVAAENFRLQVAVSDETTDLTTGTEKQTFRQVGAVTLTEVRASVSTAPAGSTIDVDINVGGLSILSTKLTIDAGEKTSTTAATAAVISTSSIADDAEVTIDIDQVGSSTAGAGLKVSLIGTYD